MRRSETKEERQAVLIKGAYISERKVKIIGNTTYNVGIVYKENGTAVSNVFLSLMAERYQYQNQMHIKKAG